MSRFLSDLNIERLPRKRGFWRVAKPLIYLDSHGRTWEVLAGTETDGASIPRLFWRVIGHPFDWQYAESAVLHDHLYSMQLVCRREADDLFREAMKSQGVSAWKRYVMWAAVRVFGKWSWERTVWTVIMTMALIAMAAGCKSTYVETRAGRPVSVEVRKMFGAEISRTEVAKPTPEEIRIDEINSLSRRGGWMLTIGGLVAACGIALALYSHVQTVDQLAMLAASSGGGVAAWGLVLMGIAWHIGIIMWLAACAAVAGIVWYIRKRERATP